MNREMEMTEKVSGGLVEYLVQCAEGDVVPYVSKNPLWVQQDAPFFDPVD